jgi:hypothetical protein
MIISVSDKQLFQRCRQQWDLISRNRQSWEKVGPPAAALHLGSAVHVGLEANALKLNPIIAMQEYFEREERVYIDVYKAQVGTYPGAEEIAVFRAQENLAIDLLQHYMRRYGTDTPLGSDFEYVKAEMPFQVPIPGTGGWLRGVIDGLAKHRHYGTHYLVEHKTYSYKPNKDNMDLDDQCLGYCWAAEQLFGVPISGMLWDGLNKKLPGRPRLLQSGALSKEFIDTTADVYLDTLQAYREAPGANLALLDPSNYDDIVRRLRERDALPQTPFFSRFELTYPQHAIKMWGDELRSIYLEMTSNPRIYKTVPWTGCWDCPVQDLCKAITYDEDVKFVLAASYRKSTYHSNFGRGKKIVVPKGTVKVPL